MPARIVAFFCIIGDLRCLRGASHVLDQRLQQGSLSPAGDALPASSRRRLTAWCCHAVGRVRAPAAGLCCCYRGLGIRAAGSQWRVRSPLGARQR